MFISEIAEQRGLPVKVTCNSSGYPPFEVIQQIDEGSFLARYGNGQEFTVLNCLGDYEIAN